MSEIPFLFGFFAAFFSGIGMLALMARVMWWAKVLHVVIAVSQFWTAFVYALVLIDVLTPGTYAKFVYPISIFVLSPGWVVWLTYTFARRSV